MVLGKLPVPVRPTILITVGQGPIALAVGAGGGGLDIFTLIYPFSSFSLSLGDGSIWTEILSQRAVKPKTTNQPTIYIGPSPRDRGWSGGAMVLGKLPVPGASYNFDYSRARACCACRRCGWGWFLLFLPLFGRRPDID